MRAEPKPPVPFDEFYATYVLAHRHPLNRALHLLAKVLMLLVLAAALWQRNLWLLLVLPVVAVAPCWLGHLLFERNQPTSWTRPSESLLGWLRLRLSRAQPTDTAAARPYYSFLADVVMCASMCGLHRRSAAVDDRT